MPIKNSQSRIPRAGIVRLGGKKSANAPGRNTSYFRLDTKELPQEFIEERLGKEPKELRIKFPRIDRNNEQKSLEFIFDASYKAYKKGALFCKGDGETALRAIAKDKQKEVPCTCPLYGTDCKQRGELRVSLCDLPYVGYFQIGTSSWNSINSIQGVIDTYYALLKERFWITEFILYKEETMLQGHRQYVMRMKVASNFLKELPTGAEINSAMTFEDDEYEEPEPMPPVETETPVSETPVSEAPSEVETPPEEPQVETPPELPKEPVTTPAPQAEPAEEMPPPEPEMPPMESAPLPKEEPAQEKKPSVSKAVDASPSPTTTATETPSPSVTPASPSEPAKRNITPQRRMKEQRLRNALVSFKKVGEFPDEPDELCKYFPCGSPARKTIDQLDEAELGTYLAEVLQAVKDAEAAKANANTVEGLLTPEDIPY